MIADTSSLDTPGVDCHERVCEFRRRNVEFGRRGYGGERSSSRRFGSKFRIHRAGDREGQGSKSNESRKNRSGASFRFSSPVGCRGGSFSFFFGRVASVLSFNFGESPPGSRSRDPRYRGTDGTTRGFERVPFLANTIVSFVVRNEEQRWSLDVLIATIRGNGAGFVSRLHPRCTCER